MGRLVADILLHFGLGLVLLAYLWLAGLGWLSLLRGRRRTFVPAEAVYAYPVGVVATVVGAALLLAGPWWAVLGALWLLAPLVGLVLVPEPARGFLSRVRWPVTLSLPFAFAASFVLGILWHGPTARLDAFPFGDTTNNAARAYAALESLSPFHDLLVEGERFGYAQSAAPLIGAVLTPLPRMDILLFDVVALPAFALLSVCVGFALLASDENGSRARALGPLFVVVPAISLAMVVVPSWLAENVSASFGVPLAFAVYRLTRDRRSLQRLAALAGVLVVAAYLAKVVVLLPLAAVIAGVVVRDHLRRLKPVHLLAGAALAGLILAAILTGGLLGASWYQQYFRRSADLWFLPVRVVQDLGPSLGAGRGLHAFGAPLAILGEALLAIAVWRTRDRVVTAALAVSIAAYWIVEGINVYSAVGVSVLLAALVLLAEPGLIRQERAILLPAAAALALSVWLEDAAGYANGLVLVGSFGAALLLVLAGAQRWLVGAAAVTAVASVAATAAIGFGAVDARRDAVSLTRQDYDIWRAVFKRVPPDGLVFTSLTGTGLDLHAGGNYYAALSRRQLYLGGWTDSRLRVHRDEVAERVRLNGMVLGGDVAPRSVQTSRRYSAYFAVVERRRRMPPSDRLLYENASYALYRIRS